MKWQTLTLAALQDSTGLKKAAVLMNRFANGKCQDFYENDLFLMCVQASTGSEENGNSSKTEKRNTKEKTEWQTLMQKEKSMT